MRKFRLLILNIKYLQYDTRNIRDYFDCFCNHFIVLHFLHKYTHTFTHTWKYYIQIFLCAKCPLYCCRQSQMLLQKLLLFFFLPLLFSGKTYFALATNLYYGSGALRPLIPISFFYFICQCCSVIILHLCGGIYLRALELLFASGAQKKDIHYYILYICWARSRRRLQIFVLHIRKFTLSLRLK